MGKNDGKKSLMDKVTDFTTRLSGPLAKFSNLKSISSIVNGLIAIMPIIMVGAIFMILYVFGSPSIGTSGHALIPFLEPLAKKFLWMNNITLGFMSLYAVIVMSQNYGQRLGLEVKSSGLIGLGTFLTFTLANFDKAGGIDITAFSSSGLFVGIVSSLVSVRIYWFFIKNNITIKMPASVPPNIGNSFAAIFPYAASFTLAWFVRTILNFDMLKWLNGLLEPIVNGSQSVWSAMLVVFITLLLWSVGLHGDNMFLMLFTPFGVSWLSENAKALANGTPSGQLPNILAGIGQTGLLRMTTWTAAVWPVIFLMIISKNKFLKTLGWTTIWPGIFTIVEPVIFGMPLALNPYLMIPFILSGTISSGVGYLLMSTPFFGKFFAMIPWATPPFLLGPLGTGDWKTVFIPIISFFIGLIIYLPFWKGYVHSLDEEAEEQLAKDAE
jgi:PTS system cellobiose-specific IIC component